MLQVLKYKRKPFIVEAVQVTVDNMADVAEWCRGDVRADGVNGYVKVRVFRAVGHRQTQAFVGDYVIKMGKGFKIYTPKAFEESFEEYNELVDVVEEEPPTPAV